MRADDGGRFAGVHEGLAAELSRAAEPRKRRNVPLRLRGRATVIHSLRTAAVGVGVDSRGRYGDVGRRCWRFRPRGLYRVMEHRRAVPHPSRVVELFESVPLAVACPGTGCEGLAVEEATTGEAHISAKHPSSGPQARFPCPYAHAGRTGSRSIPAPARPQPAVGLIGRIRDRATFEALRREGRRARCDGVSVVYLAASTGEARVAYSIGRKVGRAVVRNRVRRRLRAAVRQLADEGVALPPGAYLVRVAPSVAKQSYHDVYRSLARACAGVVAEEADT